MTEPYIPEPATRWATERLVNAMRAADEQIFDVRQRELWLPEPEVRDDQ